MDSELLQRRRAERARARRRRVMRRRVGALAGVIVVIAVIAVVLGSAGGGASNGGGSPSGGAALTANQHRASGTRRRTHARRHPTPAASHGDTASALGPATGRPGTASVPILMYHVIAAPPAGAPFPGLYVNASEFAAQMQALKAAGWTAVTLDQLRANWTDGARLPAGKPVVLTFDNGYRSQYTAALPVLRRLHWVADENMQLTGLPPSQGGLTDQQVQGLIDAGWELDTQGISHADLITLDAQQLQDQIASARQILRHRYHVPVNWFCYPSGHYNPTVVAAVKAAGFVGSTTVVPGWTSPASDLYRLPRLRVLGGTSPAELLAQIASARGDASPGGSYPSS